MIGMANYRRWRLAGGSYFFTLVTKDRTRIFEHAVARRLLGQQLRECRRVRPFEVNAIVLLPEHLHTIWTLPRGDQEYSARWAWIKKEFTKAWLAVGGAQVMVSPARNARRDRGVWQPRFWEHVIRDEGDFDRHLDYIHYNPVKHGHVNVPADWQWSSIHRWVKAGVYEAEWGRSSGGPLSFEDLDETAMEF